MATALVLPNFITADASGNIVFTGQEQGPNGSASAPTYSFTSVPNTGWYYDSTNSSLAASINGTETWQLTSNGALTNLGTSITNKLQFGPSNATGVVAFRNGNALMQFAAADLSSNATLAARTFQITNDTGGPQLMAAYATTTGVYIASAGPGVALVCNNNTGISITSTGQAKTLANATSTRATSVSVLATDSFTVYNNTGAGAQVTYTLPTAAAGLNYTFINTASGATFTKILATGTDRIAQAGTLGAAAGNLTSTAIWSTITLVGMAAGTWVVTASTGGAYTLT